MRLRVLELGRFPTGDHPVPGFLVELDDGRRLLLDQPARTRTAPDDVGSARCSWCTPRPVGARHRP